MTWVNKKNNTTAEKERLQSGKSSWVRMIPGLFAGRGYTRAEKKEGT